MIEFDGSPILLPFYPGTGVYDIVVKVSGESLDHYFLNPKKFPMELPLTQLDMGRWPALLERKMQDGDLYIRLIVDTRFLEPVLEPYQRNLAVYFSDPYELMDKLIRDQIQTLKFDISNVNQDQLARAIVQNLNTPKSQTKVILTDSGSGYGNTLMLYQLDLTGMKHAIDFEVAGRRISRDYLVVDDPDVIKTTPRIKFGVVKEDPFEKVIDAGLVIDLGNTRSYALLVDDLTGRSGFVEPQVKELELKSYSSWTQGGEAGVFDSTLGFGSPHRLPSRIVNELPEELTKPVYYSENLSFVRVGREGRYMQQRVSADKTARGISVLSSPKRYYWQNDKENREWRMWNPLTGERESISLPLEGMLADALREKYPNIDSPHFLPRASMLSAMFIELIEQAERILNNPDYLKSTDLPGPRRISQVLVTYPSAWTKSEVSLYKEQLRKGIDAYAKLRALPVPEVKLECDEASAVLLNYVYSEIRKYGLVGENWIKSVGSGEKDGHGEVRIAIIDLGGGTSDLMIADVVDTEPGGGCHLRIDRYYQDGVNKAGDELLRIIVEKIVLPAVGWNLFGGASGPEWERLTKHLLGGGKTEYSELRRSWTRSLWIPFALKIIDAVASDNPGRISLIDLNLRLFGNVVEKIAAELNIPLQPMARRNELELPTGFRDIFRQICAGVFSPIARRFGAAIAAFGCDRVVFAGKTSEIPFVRELFMEFIPVPPGRFIPLQGFLMGSWFPLSGDGRIADAKTTAGFGGAIYLLSDVGSPQLGAGIAIDIGHAPGLGEHLHYWGFVQPNSLRFSNSASLFGPGSGNGDTRTIKMTSRSYLIGRRRFSYESMDAEIAYEVRIRPEYASIDMPQSTSFTLKYVLHQDDTVELELSGADGRLADGARLELRHLELRHRCLAQSDFWLDSGNIFPN